MPNFTSLPPLALYIHIPWCVRKCPYCDFNSHKSPDSLPEQTYVNNLLNDLEHHLPEIWGRRLSSIFIGGGTPSLFSASSINRLLAGIHARLACISDMEITLEANPGTLEQGRFGGFRAAGINRLSIGVQSFNDQHLQQLGRIHDSRQARNAIESAMNAGFDNLNIDLMFGLPEQSIEQGLDDLEQALSFNTSHLSWYQLTLEPNTLFYSKPPRLPDDDRIADLQDQGQQLINEHGFTQYEISAYARNGKACRHNLNYWEFGDYLGIGAGAHGKISRSDSQQIQRYWNLRQPEDYMSASAVQRISGQQLLDTDDIVFEFMLNALRLKQGFNRNTFQQHTGLDISLIEAACARAMTLELLEQTGEEYRPSELGYRFLNDLVSLFAPVK
ncbi:MAG: radical SAM family heme chaperone HemW [Gammaproteobacteria bacterium]|nr:radical SAM family heme chaperone HemW [Gammaproteobacteria bacterium]